MVAAEDEHMRRRRADERIEVLKHRIGRALVPAGARTLPGGHGVDERTQPTVQRPDVLQMADQTPRLVLRQNADMTQP